MYKFLIPLFVLALLIGCSPKTETTTDQYNSDDSMTYTYTADPSTTFDGTILAGKHVVVMETSMGDITLEIDADAAPKTATNFIALAQMGYYNGLNFHRVIPDFMIQAGDPNGNGTGGQSVYGDTFEDEKNSLVMERGVIAMANRGPNTNGSQFFIVQAEDGTPWLQGLHTIFGKVTDGMDVVDKIATAERDGNDMPIEPITYNMKVVKL